MAIALAGWLYETFGLESFIDSCIWGYADDLLKKLDKEYCKTTRQGYNYQSRNYSTSHVHMMLNMALMQMIDKTECLFFLNTPNSIDLSDIETRTLSPWIYSEIGISQMINKKIRTKKFSDNLDESLKISYKLDLSHLANITDSDLLQWKQKGAREVRANEEHVECSAFSDDSSLDESDVGHVIAADLIDPVHDLKQAVDVVQLRVSPQAGICGIRRVLVQERIGILAPGDLTCVRLDHQAVRGPGKKQEPQARIHGAEIP